MAEWPCCHDPLRFSPWSPRFGASLLSLYSKFGRLSPLHLRSFSFKRRSFCSHLRKCISCLGAGNLGFPCRRCERGRQSAELVVGGMETPNFHVAARRKTSPGLRNLGFPRPPAPPEGNTLGKLGFPFRGTRRRAAPEPGKLGVSMSRP